MELVLHLQHSRSTHSPDAAAARARAQVLIQDILGGRLVVETEAGGENYLRAHGFTDLGKALAASRALQLAFEGFRSAGSAGRPNISLVLDSFSAEEAPTSYTSPSVEQKDLLHLARPSQVLITQVLYDRIGPCQPLALRSFPNRAGVYELLWTSAERLDELRAEAESVPALVEPTSTASAEEPSSTVRLWRLPRLRRETRFRPRSQSLLTHLLLEKQLLKNQCQGDRIGG